MDECDGYGAFADGRGHPTDCPLADIAGCEHPGGGRFERERIAAALLVVDARREPTELDQVMKEWLEGKEIPYLVAATKTDMLSGNGRARAERELLLGFGGARLSERRTVGDPPS